MRTIILTVGIPGAGKSTWTIQEMRKNPGRYKRINKDLMREMLDAGAFNPRNEKYIFEVREHMVEKALFAGYDVIVDDTNFSSKHWDSMCTVAQRVGDVTVVEKYFDISLKEALTRNVSRPNPVPEDVITKMFDKHVKNGHRTTQTAYYPIPILTPPYEDGKPSCIMVDLDGTLALLNGRDPYDTKTVYNDLVNQPILDLVLIFKRMAASSSEVIFMSGREELAREDTERWLVDKCGFSAPIKLYMRKTGDKRPDVIIKPELYNAHVKPYYNVEYIIDDRNCVCRMWRSLGFTVLQVNSLEF